MTSADFLTGLARSSLAASVLILLVLMTQRAFRRQLTPFWQCALWWLVLVRLLPLSLTSGVSLYNLVPYWGAAAGTNHRRGDTR